VKKTGEGTSWDEKNGGAQTDEYGEEEWEAAGRLEGEHDGGRQAANGKGQEKKNCHLQKQNRGRPKERHWQAAR